MVAKGQVPSDELTSHALEELLDDLLTIFRLRQHALDSVRSKTTTRDVDRHGISPTFCRRTTFVVTTEHYRRGFGGFKGQCSRRSP
jgi:hypothetical protein